VFFQIIDCGRATLMMGRGGVEPRQQNWPSMMRGLSDTPHLFVVLGRQCSERGARRCAYAPAGMPASRISSRLAPRGNQREIAGIAMTQSHRLSGDLDRVLRTEPKAPSSLGDGDETTAVHYGPWRRRGLLAACSTCAKPRFHVVDFLNSTSWDISVCRALSRQNRLVRIGILVKRAADDTRR